MRLHNAGTFDRIPSAVDSLRRYGAVRPGDLVRIDAEQRRVYVNGQLRAPRHRPRPRRQLHRLDKREGE